MLFMLLCGVKDWRLLNREQLRPTTEKLSILMRISISALSYGLRTSKPNYYKLIVVIVSDLYID